HRRPVLELEEAKWLSVPGSVALLGHSVVGKEDSFRCDTAPLVIGIPCSRHVGRTSQVKPMFVASNSIRWRCRRGRQEPAGTRPSLPARTSLAKGKRTTAPRFA